MGSREKLEREVMFLLLFEYPKANGYWPVACSSAAYELVFTFGRCIKTTLLKIKRDSTAHFLNSLFGIKQTLIF